MEDHGEFESAGEPGRAGHIAVRLASLDDLPQLMAISQAADFAARWTEQQWRDIFHTQIPRRMAWMAWDSSGFPDTLSAATSDASALPAAVGFLVAQCGGPEWELENIAVLPAFRRRGVGLALLMALLAEARVRQAERILLEVRPSNLPAIRLYGQGGFELLARRPSYYREPMEDALIMVHVL